MTTTGKIAIALFVPMVMGCHAFLGIDDVDTVDDGGADVDGSGEVGGDGSVPSSDAGDVRDITLSFRDGAGSGYNGTRDAIIDVDSSSNRGDSTDMAWNRVGTSIQEAALLRFEGVFGDEATQVPRDATIVSATLTIFVYDRGATPPGALHEIAVPWDELVVTYENFGASPGVDAGDYRADVITMLPNEVGSYELDVTESLQDWSAGISDDYGWLFLPANMSSNATRVRTREHSPSEERPMLTVTWSL